MIATVWFDLETGGLEDHHPNIAIGAVAVNNGHEVEAAEWKLQFDESACDRKALEINGYDRKDWADAINPADACRRFADFCADYASVAKTSKRGNEYKVAVLGGHNAASFDAPRLRDMFKSLDMFLPADYHVIDTLPLAVAYSAMVGDRPENFRLGTVCEWLGVDAEPGHSALDDARAAAAVWVELCRRFT